MLDEKAFLGLPLSFQTIKIYPPTIEQVISCPNFAQFLKILTLSQEEIEIELGEQKKAKENENTEVEESEEEKKEGKPFVMPTPLEYVLGNCYSSKLFKKILEDAFQFFTKESITLLLAKKQIIVGSLSDSVKTIEDLKKMTILSEENFLDFQNKIRQASGQREIEKEKPLDEMNPIERKFAEAARERERAKRKALLKKQKNGQQDGITLATTLTAICCSGIGLTPLNIGEMSYAAVAPIMEMCQNKEKYDLDIKSLLAGADSKKVKPVYWIKNYE